MSEQDPKRGRRDPKWDPPTIVYMPDGEAADPAAVRRALRRPQQGKQEGERAEPEQERTLRSTTPEGLADKLGEKPSDRPPSTGEPTMRSGATEDLTVPVAGKAVSQDELTIALPDRGEPRDIHDDVTIKAPPKTPRVPHTAPAEEADEDNPQDLKGTLRWLLRKHAKKLWWLHTVYALGLGAFVVSYAQKGFDHARWLAISVGVAWLVVVLFFRLFGSGARQDFATAWKTARLRFLVMTYVLKNLYQGMLFFLLPFYWKSATLDAPNRWFVLILGACAVLSTLDLVFDRVLMRWKTLASIFYGVTLFACLNLVIPALFPNTRTLYTLLSAAAVAVLGFSMLHLPLGALRSPVGVGLLFAALGTGMGLSYVSRTIIPPVPMHLSFAAVGPTRLPDGRLAMEVKALHASVIRELLAVTDVVVPGGKGDRLQHVWRLDGEEVFRAPEETSRVAGPEGAVRLLSSLTGRRLPARLVGRWSVDVETEDGQLVGRVAFEVKE